MPLMTSRVPWTAQWLPDLQRHFYSTREIPDPAKDYSCFIECHLTDLGTCDFYVYENGLCYLASLGIMNSNDTYKWTSSDFVLFIGNVT